MARGQSAASPANPSAPNPRRCSSLPPLNDGARPPPHGPPPFHSGRAPPPPSNSRRTSGGFANAEPTRAASGRGGGNPESGRRLIRVASVGLASEGAESSEDPALAADDGSVNSQGERRSDLKAWLGSSLGGARKIAPLDGLVPQA